MIKAVIWSKPSCPHCVQAKTLMNMKGIEYEEKNIAEGHDIREMFKLVPNARTMPQIWVDGELVNGGAPGKLTHIGGHHELQQVLGGQ